MEGWLGLVQGLRMEEEGPAHEIEMFCTVFHLKF